MHIVPNSFLHDQQRRTLRNLIDSHPDLSLSQVFITLILSVHLCVVDLWELIQDILFNGRPVLIILRSHFSFISVKHDQKHLPICAVQGERPFQRILQLFAC